MSCNLFPDDFCYSICSSSDLSQLVLSKTRKIKYIVKQLLLINNLHLIDFLESTDLIFKLNLMIDVIKLTDSNDVMSDVANLVISGLYDVLSNIQDILESLNTKHYKYNNSWKSYLFSFSIDKYLHNVMKNMKVFNERLNYFIFIKKR